MGFQTTANQFNGRGSYSATQVFYSDSKTYNGTFILRQKPLTVTEATEIVEITGVLKNFTGLAGCNANIKAVFVKDVPQF
jgi:hypothetical protein